MFRRNLAGLLVLVMLLSLVACAAPTGSDGTTAPAQEPSSPPPPTQEQTAAPTETPTETPPAGPTKYSGTITFSYGEGSETPAKPIYEKVIEAYKKLQPDVTVVLDPKATETYTDWLSSQLASGSASSDIVTMNTVAKYVWDGKFVDFNEYVIKPNPYMDNNMIWKEGLDSAVLRPNGPNEGVYNLNIDSVQVLWFYNKKIFQEVGVQPPENWDQLVEISKKIKDAGYTPLCIPGDARSFWEMEIGWLMRIYHDQYWRDMEPIAVSQPEDYNYDPDLADWKFDMTDYNNDVSGVVKFNGLRVWKAIQEGKVSADSDRFRDMYINFAKMFPTYCQEGFFGTTVEKAKEIFLQGNSAMRVDGAWFAAQFDDLIKDSANPFEIGYFWSPPMVSEHASVNFTRSLGGPNGFIGVINKDAETNARNMDFMMYYGSPQGQSVRYEAMAGLPGYSPSGPSLVKNVKMPDKWDEIFTTMGYRGECDNNPLGCFNRGFGDVQESVRGWTEAAQNYFTGKITIEDFSKTMQKNILDGIQLKIKESNYRPDCLDDVTKDPEIK